MIIYRVNLNNLYSLDKIIVIYYIIEGNSYRDVCFSGFLKGYFE